MRKFTRKAPEAILAEIAFSIQIDEEEWGLFPCEFESWLIHDLIELYQKLEKYYGYDLLKEKIAKLVIYVKANEDWLFEVLDEQQCIEMVDLKNALIQTKYKLQPRYLKNAAITMMAELFSMVSRYQTTNFSIDAVILRKDNKNLTAREIVFQLRQMQKNKMESGAVRNEKQMVAAVRTMGYVAIGLNADGNHLITSNELAPVVLRVEDLFGNDEHFQKVMELRKTMSNDRSSKLYRYHPYHWPEMIHAESMLAVLRQQLGVQQLIVLHADLNAAKICNCIFCAVCLLANGFKSQYHNGRIKNYTHVSSIVVEQIVEWIALLNDRFPVKALQSVMNHVESVPSASCHMYSTNLISVFRHVRAAEDVKKSDDEERQQLTNFLIEHYPHQLNDPGKKETYLNSERLGQPGLSRGKTVRIFDDSRICFSKDNVVSGENSPRTKMLCGQLEKHSVTSAHQAGIINFTI